VNSIAEAVGRWLSNSTNVNNFFGHKKLGLTERINNMKKTVAIVLLGALAAMARAENHADVSSGSLLTESVAVAPPQEYTPRDPQRTLDGLHYSLRGIDPKHGWVAFQGRIIEVQEGNGVRMTGSFTGVDPAQGSVEFFVTNFPYPMAEEELIGDHFADGTFFLAKIAGTHTYRTVAGGSRTIRMLDYGQIFAPTPKELDAMRKAALAKKEAEQKKAAAAEDKALKMNQELADKGDAYGLLRMGERYRDGEGVEKDLARARAYFQKAVDAGSPTAADDLKKLSQ
jgi:hypothetical protein